MIPLFLDSARKHKNLARTYKNWLPDAGRVPVVGPGRESHGVSPMRVGPGRVSVEVGLRVVPRVGPRVGPRGGPSLSPHGCWKGWMALMQLG
jgi:hypothetical protein